MGSLRVEPASQPPRRDERGAPPALSGWPGPSPSHHHVSIEVVPWPTRPLRHGVLKATGAGWACSSGALPSPLPVQPPPPPVQPRPARVPRAAAGGRACDGRGACLSHTPNTPPLTPSTAAHQRGPSSQFLVHATTPTLHCGPYSTDAPRSVVSPLLSLDFFFFLDTSKVACVSLRGCGVAWVRGCVGGVSGGGPPLGASRGRTRRRAPAGVSRAAL